MSSLLFFLVWNIPLLKLSFDERYFFHTSKNIVYTLQHLFGQCIENIILSFFFFFFDLPLLFLKHSGKIHILKFNIGAMHKKNVHQNCVHHV